jgi:hypothetical protein
LYVHGFRFYFTPLTGVLFAFPSRYWFTIGRSVVFSLGGWSPHVQTTFHVRRPTRITLIKISHTGLSPCIVILSRIFCYLYKCFRAGPRSLAATKGISVDFFSSGYLDVSVPQVRLSKPMYSVKRYHKWWVPPFGNPRIKAYLSAPRSLSQIITSFIASDCQGIHRVRLVT